MSSRYPYFHYHSDNYKIYSPPSRSLLFGTLIWTILYDVEYIIRTGKLYIYIYYTGIHAIQSRFSDASRLIFLILLLLLFTINQYSYNVPTYTYLHYTPISYIYIYTYLHNCTSTAHRPRMTLYNNNDIIIHNVYLMCITHLNNKRALCTYFHTHKTHASIFLTGTYNE